MLVPDRHRLLLGQIHANGSAEVESLAHALGVSDSTVRRDLARLEAQGRLRRTRGGAYVDRPGGGPRATASPLDVQEAKVRIGRTAAGQVVDGMTVMILAGTTTATMIPYLARRSITVVTNGLDIGYELAGHADISLVVLGGVLHREQMTLLGPMTVQSMADLHVDVMFAGAYGVHPDNGVTGSKLAQAGYHHSMLRHADSLVVLADASKLGRRGPTVLARLDQVAQFVTDRAASTAVVAGLRARGASIALC